MGSWNIRCTWEGGEALSFLLPPLTSIAFSFFSLAKDVNRQPMRSAQIMSKNNTCKNCGSAVLEESEALSSSGRVVRYFLILDRYSLFLQPIWMLIWKISSNTSKMKYILVTGGVISGIGKGVISSSIGALLKGVGLHVTSIKIDPYLNIDAGTFSPYEHGKVNNYCFPLAFYAN